MENKCGLCSRCRFFSPYYTKGAKKFNKTQYGLCCKQSETTDIHGGCDKFESRPKYGISRGILKNYLSDLLTEISELRKVVEAEISENEEV